MAEEYLKRTPTSDGNRKTFTISVWAKRNSDATSHRGHLFNAGPTNDFNDTFAWYLNSGHNLHLFNRVGGTYGYYQTPPAKYQDYSGWTHYLAYVDTTQNGVQEVKVAEYVNGVLQSAANNAIDPISINYKSWVNNRVAHYIGKRIDVLTGNWHGQMMDFYIVDGQALTPDVFGFYKVGDGYVSAGTTRSTKFRPGQWVPKSPSVIKNTINNNGGFGVNGVYLPMNDSSNFGADFHTTPNSIITLKGEDLPQPRNGAPETTDAYVSQLRTDPYAANLVLAVPGIIGAPGVAYTDFSANIKGSGTNKVITANGAAGVAVTASYYGSAMSFTGVAGTYFSIPNSADLRFGSEDFTIEAWCNIDNVSGEKMIISLFNTSSQRSYRVGLSADNTVHVFSANGTSTDTLTTSAGIVASNQWNHIAFVKEGLKVTHYVNGVAVGIKTNSIASLHDNTGDNIEIGQFTGGSSVFDGYMQDLRVYKGVAKYKGGFDVPKPYTPVGIATWRAVPDTTANNFATLNAVVKSAALSDGNLTKNGISAAWSGEVSTIGINTGKWYQEYYYTDLANNGSYYHGLGIRVGTGSSEDTSFRELNGEYWGTKTYNHVGLVKNTAMTLYNNGNKGDILSGTFTGAHTIMQAIDASTGKCWWGIDGTWANSGNPTNGTGVSTSFATGSYVIPTTATFTNTYKGYLNFGQNPSFSGNTTAGTFTDSNSKGLFKYQPPSGFLALCEDNLPTPAISDPGKYFKTVCFGLVMVIVVEVLLVLDLLQI
jgi:hypothetical protein